MSKSKERCRVGRSGGGGDSAAGVVFGAEAHEVGGVRGVG